MNREYGNFLSLSFDKMTLFVIPYVIIPNKIIKMCFFK